MPRPESEVWQLSLWFASILACFGHWHVAGKRRTSRASVVWHVRRLGRVTLWKPLP